MDLMRPHGDQPFARREVAGFRYLGHHDQKGVVAPLPRVTAGRSVVVGGEIVQQLLKHRRYQASAEINDRNFPSETQRRKVLYYTRFFNHVADPSEVEEWLDASGLRGPTLQEALQIDADDARTRGQGILPAFGQIVVVKGRKVYAVIYGTCMVCTREVGSMIAGTTILGICTD